MPVYRFTEIKTGKVLGEVKAQTLERAWPLAIEELKLYPYIRDDKMSHEIVGFPDQNANDLEAIVKTLTYNGAANLYYTVTKEDSIYPDSLGPEGRIFTGLGKWTTLGAMGVFFGLRAKGLAEERIHGFNTPGYRSCPYTGYYVTPLGRRVGEYIRDHWWDERMSELRDLSGKR